MFGSRFGFFLALAALTGSTAHADLTPEAGSSPAPATPPAAAPAPAAPASAAPPAPAAPAAHPATPPAKPKPRVVVNLQTFEPQPTLPKADGPRAAVKLDYMMSDDTIIWAGARQTLDAFAALPAQPATAHSLVFLDDPQNGPSLWLLGDNPTSGVSKSPLAPGMSHVPANSMQLMTKVLRWAFASYPGERRYLQIDSHGGGVFGIGSDAHDNPYTGLRTRMLPIQGFARALRDGTGGKPIDVVFFNACMMSSVEALYEIAPSVRYTVGSELTIGAYDRTIVRDMPLLFEQSIRAGQSPEQIARGLAEQAMKATSTGVTTAVAMNLGKLAPLVAQIGKLGKVLLASLPASKAKIQAAIDAARLPGQPTLADLWTLARGVMQGVTDPAVQAEARALFRLEAGATLFEKTRLASDPATPAVKPKSRNWGGLSIFVAKSSFLKRGYPQTRFARDTGWNKLVDALYP